MVIITVNSQDTESCSRKLKDLIQARKNIAIFSLQRGVRNSSTVKDEYVFFVFKHTYTDVV
jgi:hypothetical protein